MKLERSKKILKISGILIILGSLATIVISVIFLKGNHQGNSMQLLAGPNPQKEGITILIGSGLSMLMSGVISMIEGYLSLLASKTTSTESLPGCSLCCPWPVPEQTASPRSEKQD